MLAKYSLKTDGEVLSSLKEQTFDLATVHVSEILRMNQLVSSSHVGATSGTVSSLLTLIPTENDIPN
jgi:hypothetical protein